MNIKINEVYDKQYSLKKYERRNIEEKDGMSMMNRCTYYFDMLDIQLPNCVQKLITRIVL